MNLKEYLENLKIRSWWDIYDFEVSSKAVVVCGHQTSISWYAGVYTHTLSTFKVPLNPPSRGIWIWEGTCVPYKDIFAGWVLEKRGAYRTPTDEEWTDIKAGKAPWDPYHGLTSEARERIIKQNIEWVLREQQMADEDGRVFTILDDIAAGRL